ncbi:MAG TPA: tyrosine-type recombinase/integrase [Actinoplanes sp.]|nr:tyrosine-type recombinase/integrase [Actinoplanes sp.]
MALAPAGSLPAILEVYCRPSQCQHWEPPAELAPFRRPAGPGGRVRRIRFHDLRHSGATLLYEQGVEITKIQGILGHSSPTITKLVYVEVTRESQRATADKLSYLFDA